MGEGEGGFPCPPPSSLPALSRPSHSLPLILINRPFYHREIYERTVQNVVYRDGVCVCVHIIMGVCDQ